MQNFTDVCMVGAQTCLHTSMPSWEKGNVGGLKYTLCNARTSWRNSSEVKPELDVHVDLGISDIE